MKFTINNPNTKYLSKNTSLTEGQVPYDYDDLANALRVAVSHAKITEMDQLLISQYYWAKETYQQKKDAVIKAIEMDEYNSSTSVSPDALRLYKKQINIEAAKFLHMCSISALNIVVNKVALPTDKYDSSSVILDQELVHANGEISHDNPKAILLNKANYNLKIVH